jgi:hypothetical protein
MKPRVARSKTMRVATALTGMTACAAGFLPTAAAHAAVRGGQLPAKTDGLTPGKGKMVRLGVHAGGLAASPDNIPVQHSYSLNVVFKPSVTNYQVCGYHRPNHAYRCTTYVTVPKQTTSWTASEVGGNKYSWSPGPITIRWNNGGPGRNDGCNTKNGDYYGWPAAASVFVSLYAPGGTGIGDGVPTC